jgi:hypothetical protein
MARRGEADATDDVFGRANLQDVRKKPASTSDAKHRGLVRRIATGSGALPLRRPSSKDVQMGSYDPDRLPDETAHGEGDEASEGVGVDEAAATISREFGGAERSAEAFAAKSASARDAARARFASLDPNGVIPRKLLDTALSFFQENEDKFQNRNVISILDYSPKSTQPRFHVVDLATGAVTSLHMSHGKGSDPEHDGFATSFGNVSGSNKSCLGFARTAETYSGAHGLSLKLDGLSPSNSNMRPRAIVVHGAEYVQDRAVIQGRSLGCPAVSMAQRTSLIDRIKGGSLLFAGLGKD